MILTLTLITSHTDTDTDTDTDTGTDTDTNTEIGTVTTNLLPEQMWTIALCDQKQMLLQLK